MVGELVVTIMALSEIVRKFAVFHKVLTRRNR